jgi:hypothetical protein
MLEQHQLEAMDKRLSRVELIVDDVDKKVDRVLLAIVGDEQTGIGGMKVRIEQAEKNILKLQENYIEQDKVNERLSIQQKILWSIIGGSIVFLVTYFFQTITETHFFQPIIK